MHLLEPTAWPLLFICAGMILCAVVDWWKFKVPNAITFPLILLGWLYGLLHTLGLSLGDAGTGGIGDALLGTFVGMGLLYPLYIIGGVGAGDVKMQMAFGAWIGGYYTWYPGWLIILLSFFAGAIVGGILSAILIVLRGEYRQNVAHVHVILTDLMTLGPRHLKTIEDRALERKPRWHRIPYGVPLCLGFLGYLILAPYIAGKPQPTSESGASSALSGKSLGATSEIPIIVTGDSSPTTKRV